jgi:hypothetical protein
MADIDDLLADVAAGQQGPDVGAFFDFDGTLIHVSYPSPGKGWPVPRPLRSDVEDCTDAPSR